MHFTADELGADPSGQKPAAISTLDREKYDGGGFVVRMQALEPPTVRWRRAIRAHLAHAPALFEAFAWTLVCMRALAHTPALLEAVRGQAIVLPFFSEIFLPDQVRRPRSTEPTAAPR